MKKLLLTVLSLVFTLTTFALDFESFGYTNKGTKSIDSINFIELSDAGNHNILLTSEKELTDADAKLVFTMLNAIYSVTSAKTNTIKVFVQAEKLIALVSIEGFRYNDQDFLPNLPNGLQFYYTNRLEYDFRVKSGKYFVRINGTYFTEADLCKVIAEAINDPVQYIKTHDEAYIIQKLAELEQETERLNLENTRLRNAIMAMDNRFWIFPPNFIKEETIQEVLTLKKDSPKLTKAEAMKLLQAKKVGINDQELNLIYFYYFNEQ